MARQLSTAQNTAIQGKVVRVIDLVKIELPKNTIRVTNFEADVSTTYEDGSTANTYSMGQGYLFHTGIALTTQTSNQTVTINFDGINIDSSADSIVRMFANDNYSAAPVTIAKHIVTNDNFGVNSTATINDVFVVFKGIVDNFSIKVTDQESIVSVFCSGPFADFERTALYGYTNIASQSKVYPNDRGFKFSQNNVRNIRWEE